ncbi:MAG: hypothetical protein ACOX37_12100 [Bacillota bacterium]
MIGKTNRSIPGLNNVVGFAPALVVTKEEIDQIASAVRAALEKNQ